MANLKLVCALVFCMLVIAPMAYAIDCNQLLADLGPCFGYVTSDGSGPVPANCCDGVRSLNNAATTTADRQKACQCFQNAAKTISNINTKAAAGLPGKCGVNIPYKMSTSTDCSSIK